MHNQHLMPFYWQMILSYGYVNYLCLVINWWTFGLFLLFLLILLIILLRTCTYKILHGHMFSFLITLYLAVQLLDHRVTCFQKRLYHFKFPPGMYKDLKFLTSLSALTIIYDIPSHLRNCLIVVLIFISVIANIVFCVLLGHLYFFGEMSVSILFCFIFVFVLDSIT